MKLEVNASYNQVEGEETAVFKAKMDGETLTLEDILTVLDKARASKSPSVSVSVEAIEKLNDLCTRLSRRLRDFPTVYGDIVREYVNELGSWLYQNYYKDKK